MERPSFTARFGSGVQNKLLEWHDTLTARDRAYDPVEESLCSTAFPGANVILAADRGVHALKKLVVRQFQIVTPNADPNV